MFSQKKVVEKLEAISQKEAEVNKRIWIPQYHSLAEIDSFNSHFIELGRKCERDGREIETALGFEELEWIDNEYKICACDYRYWSENYAYINASGEIRRFKRRASQEMMVSLWAEREELGFGIEQQYLKGRQQGVSTEVELAITHCVNFGMGVNAAVASYDSDACERMAGMMQLAYNEQPAWMKANPTSDRAGSLMAFGGNSTRLNLYSGRKATGIARGDTPSKLHISEVSSFPNAKAIIENSLFQSVHPSPRIFMVLESTGNGNTDWWAQTWYHSRDNWPHGARLQPVFLPWFIAIDLFPGETWRREHPVPANWYPMPETERMMNKAAAYVHQTPLMRKFLGDDWRMPPYQAYFWEVRFNEYRAKGNAKGWLQEMATDDIEALQPKKDLVFDLSETEKHLKERSDYTVWAITGEQIQDKFHPLPNEIDYTQDRFRVSYSGTVNDITGKHQREMIWEFVPLKTPEEKAGSIFDADCKVLVFKWPEQGYDYSIGVDTAGGSGGDNTVICVNRRSLDGSEPDEQVAEFSSNRVPHAMAHAWILALASLYSAEMNQEPLVAIEQVYGTGDAAQIQMKMHGYKRFYKFSRLDGKNPKRDQKKSRKEGWYTYDWSRTFMLGMYKNAVENHWYKLNSPFLLKNEIPAFQIDQAAGGKTRFDHEQGKHDDRIFASAIAFIIFNDTESMSRRVEHRFVGETQELAINYSFPEGFDVPYDVITDGFEVSA
ncbi:MAG: hypothetical protein KGL39_19255 [Patescibacteria group bacterium]|nr:hypothetical protein [Patescibacteria group bacterium]